MSDTTQITSRSFAKQWENVQRVRIAMDHQIERFKEDLPAAMFTWHEDAHKHLKSIESVLERGLAQINDETALANFVQSTAGLGNRVAFLAGLMPPLDEMENPAKVWKYLGLHPEGAARRQRGEFLGYSPRLKSYAIEYVAKPCMNNKASPYRALYDRRKAWTLETHPPMVDTDCEFCDAAREKTKTKRANSHQQRERKALAFDCANLGGIHWTDGHRHRDAMRYMAKAIVRDMWRVSNGFEPLYDETQLIPAAIA